MRLTESVVVITGAASGIGRATALAFAGRGAAVVLAARREEALRDLARSCEAIGGRALVVTTDVTDDKAVQELARRAVERFGRIDVWVNNAAVTSFGTVLRTPLEEFRRVLEVNIMGYVHGARAALPQMREQGTGVLVNVASIVGIVPQPYTAAYCMSKAAIRILSGSLRSELRLDGHRRVKVCTVLPASIDTPFFRHAANRTGREVVPMPPVYRPERVARSIVNVVRVPRREVVAGAAGRLVLVQAKTAPGTAERMMARQVDRTHLSREHPAPDTTGNLYQPSTDRRDAEARGGWESGRKSVQRKILVAGLLLGMGVVVRRLRR